MLKEEAQINATRAREYVDALGNPSADLRAHFPLRYTRGAWNALKESGFLPQLQDPRLVYQLLAANEMIVVADASLLRIRKAQRGGKSGRSLARVAKQDSERLLHELEGLVTLLDERGLHKPVVVQQPEAPYRAA
jgi:hypothetical protein